MVKIGKTVFSLSALIFAFLVIAPVVATAQKARVDGVLNRPTIGVGETFVYTVVVSSPESVKVEDPVIPAFDGLRVTNTGTSSATATHMTAGSGGWKIETVRKVEFSFEMVALRPGKLTIPPFSIKVEDELLKTKAATINVVEGKTGASGGGQALAEEEDPLDDPDELFRQLLQRRLGAAPAHNDLPTNPNEVLFVQTEVDKKEVFEGEQITVNWYILVRGNLLSLDRTKFPDLKGFWKEIIEEVPALQFGQEVINGQVYRKALLASHALFPIKAGTVYIDEYKLKGRVQVGNGGFGFGRDYAFTRASDRVPITVLPLPKEGRPSDFTGAVGLFNVTAQMDTNVVQVNQPINLKVRFEGAGNAKLIELPPINWPEGLEVVETKSDARFFKNGQSFKEFDILLIPRHTGDMQVPAISVSLFDPAKKQYYTKNTDPISLKVIAGSAGAAGAPSSRIGGPGAKTPQAPQGPKLPEPIPQLEAAGVLPGGLGAPFIAALYALSFSILGLRAFKVFSGRAQRKDLYKALSRRIKKAEDAAKAKDYRGVGVNMINLYAEILGELSGQGGSHKEIEKMLDMGPPSLRRDFGDEILKTLAEFESLSFAPDEMLAAFKDAAVLSEKVEKARKLLKKTLDANPQVNEDSHQR